MSELSHALLQPCIPYDLAFCMQELKAYIQNVKTTFNNPAKNGMEVRGRYIVWIWVN